MFVQYNRYSASIYKSYQNMYTKQTPLALYIIEFVNVAATLAFLVLFIRRFKQLNSHSDTFKYKNYFPKMRLIFCLVFVAASIGLLTHNMTTDSYTVSSWYEYLLQGGGGQCVNSVILLVQMGVLRYQLNKEQPYTRYHFIYFIYLTLLEIVRFTFTLIDFTNNQNDLPTLLISTLIVTDTVSQLIYWQLKRKSLPQFVDPVDVEIDDLNFHTRHIQSRNANLEKSSYTKGNKRFPYIVPFVRYDDNKFKIVLERMNYCRSDNRSTKTSEKKRHYSEVQESLLTNSPVFKGEESGIDPEILAVTHFTLDQIKRLYAICARFPLKNEINFQQTSISQLVHAIQQMLSSILSQQTKYDRQLLHFLQLPNQIVSEYERLAEKSCILRQTSDRITCMNIPEDTNGTYFSIVGYKVVQIGRHFMYYFKVTTRCRGFVSYPFKRCHQVEELYHYLKKTLKHLGKPIELSHPCKHYEEGNCKEQSYQTLSELQLFLRSLCNQYCLMNCQSTARIIQDFLGFPHLTNIQPIFQTSFFKQLKIQPKNYSLTLKQRQSATIFEFKLTKNHQFIKTIARDLNSIVFLSEELKRFIKNNHIIHRVQLQFNTKQRKQIMLHKVSKFLQEVSAIKHISKLYFAAAFFDVNQSSKELASFKATRKMEEGTVEEGCSPLSQGSDARSYLDIKISDSPPTYLSNRFSNILDDLGNEQLDQL